MKIYPEYFDLSLANPYIQGKQLQLKRIEKNGERLGESKSKTA
ncbi:hypothetical protein HDF26_001003 [Pedobacter cryoconitis]|nr:hypothetical protein [Pedobacter cryoconitis]MBB6270576.1 hypothetical protein [Pedobacter cryoconitis]